MTENQSFNQSIYDASIAALTSNGVPEEVAERASEVVAKDDPTQENLGRSSSDQEAVNEAMSHYWEHQKGGT